MSPPSLMGILIHLPTGSHKGRFLSSPNSAVFTLLRGLTPSQGHGLKFPTCSFLGERLAPWEGCSPGQRGQALPLLRHWPSDRSLSLSELQFWHLWSQSLNCVIYKGSANRCCSGDPKLWPWPSSAKLISAVWVRPGEGLTEVTASPESRC